MTDDSYHHFDTVNSIFNNIFNLLSNSKMSKKQGNLTDW